MKTLPVALVAWLATAAILQGALASSETAWLEPQDDAVRPAVIAYVDGGINPYHQAFRDALRTAHPSTYLPGYPPDAVALPLTLNASSYAEAVERDTALWESVEPGTLYWVPGTRIIGGFTGDPLRVPFLDEGGHGTRVADAGSGSVTGSNPDSLIVAIERSNWRDDLAWVRANPWIDFVSVSNGDLFFVQPIGGPNLPPDPIWGYDPYLGGFIAGTHHLWSSERAVFQAAGNFLFTSFGTNLLSQHHPPWVVSVGAAQMPADPSEGAYVCDTCDRPYEIVSRWKHDLAEHDSLDGYAPNTGTSLSTPRAAGFASLIVTEARRMLSDDRNDPSGPYAVAAPRVALPALGPLADGVFDRDELESLMRATAIPMTANAAWLGRHEVPEQVRYLHQGYGVVDPASTSAAIQILRGQGIVPPRPWDDYWHEVTDQARWAYWTPWLCNNQAEVYEWVHCPTGQEHAVQALQQASAPPL